MEFLVELIFDIIFEGSLELGTSRKVPMPVRIIAGMVLLAIYGGLFILFAMIATEALQSGDTAAALIFIAVDILIVFLVIWAFRKKYKEKNS